MLLTQNAAGNTVVELDRDGNRRADTGDSITLVGIKASLVDTSDFIFV